MCFGLVLQSEENETQLSETDKQSIEEELVFNATNGNAISACYDTAVENTTPDQKAVTHLKLAQCLNNQIIATYTKHKARLTKEDEKDIFRRSLKASTTRKILKDHLTVAHYHLSQLLQSFPHEADEMLNQALARINQVFIKMETDHCAQCYETKIGAWIQEAINYLLMEEETQDNSSDITPKSNRDEL
tara:strand:- start:423 stop:989 length:567 start_codon:yes stop_codon:yes gene_type:complete